MLETSAFGGDAIDPDEFALNNHSPDSQTITGFDPMQA
jgi:hypothetical protein